VDKIPEVIDNEESMAWVVRENERERRKP